MYKPVVVVLSLFELFDMALFQQQLLVLYNQQWPTDTAGVRVDTYLSVSDVTNH